MRTLFTDNWRFAKLPLHTDYMGAKEREREFAPVELPHDWAIPEVADFYADTDGWYIKRFSCAKQEGRCYLLRFEGVYMDCEVWVNGTKVMEWKYGYSTFEADITAQLVSGENEVMVGVHYQNPNSRWYSGAGIYRNVWFLELPQTHLVSDGIYVRAREEADGWRIRVSAEIAGPDMTKRGSEADGKGQEAAGYAVRLEIEDEVQMASVVSAQDGTGLAEAEFFLKNARVWDIAHPETYELAVELCRGAESIQTEKVTFGCRTFAVDPNEGFSLNHRRLKLNGVCMHHDMGALGAAVHKDAIRRQLRVMQRMGVNAIRTSHNMPAVELMELADELGILILSEAFDMWERPKTEFDYARFFPEWYRKDVASWVRRDRNHPSLVFWSIGNEIYDMHEGPRGQEVTRMLMEEVYKNDPEKNGLVTFGSNYMPWENAQKCADIVKIPGYNYSEKYYNEHHEKYRDWVIFGSETGSTVQSRGIYHFPLAQPVLADVDEQCSSLGNCTTSWGARSSEACVIAERDHAFSMGQFLWTGFDYIGEPTPYHTKNSYFGQTDTAGFEKDMFYIYQAAWTKEPMLHLFPYWDFNGGQTVDVRIVTNAPRAELFVNGRSLGVQQIDHAHGMRLTADYQLAYEEGEITAVAYDEAGRELARESRHSFGDSVAPVLRCTDADENVVEYTRDTDGAIVLPTGKKQLYFLEIGMVDPDGYPVENANDRVRVSVSGEGRLLGLDNGDSTDYESYQSDNRLLFSGKLLAILESSGNPGGMRVLVEPLREEACRVRKLELIRLGGRTLDKEQTGSELIVRVRPKEAIGQKLKFDVIEKSGILSNLAECQELPVSAGDRSAGIAARLKLTAKGDGAFRLRATADNGAKQVKVISELDYEAAGIGAALLNPYRFVAGGLYNDAIGDVSNGNENGVATARDGRTVVGFKGVDFGDFGSDHLTLPIFELGGERCEIDLWLGRPDEAASRIIETLVYHKPSIWNTYQEESYQLPERLSGVCDLYFELHQKIHLKGFVFERCSKAYERLNATQNQNMYGDSFTVTEDGIMDIGNNVMIDFADMDFGPEGCKSLTICGRTKNPKNTIHVRFLDGDQELRQVVEFAHAEEFTEQTFALEPVSGMQKVSFVFMPGSQFDFLWFQFKK